MFSTTVPKTGSLLGHAIVGVIRAVEGRLVDFQHCVHHQSPSVARVDNDQRFIHTICGKAIQLSRHCSLQFE